jgi:hypothetical protein
MPSTDLELLTFGRISIDLHCDQLVPDFQIHSDHVDSDTIAVVPVLLDLLGQDLQNAGEVRVWNG